jgi:hypothetical protein
VRSLAKISHDLVDSRIEHNVQLSNESKGGSGMSAAKIDQLIERAREYRRTHPLTPEERERQIRSFAFGNTHMENPSITKEDVDKAVRSLRGSESATRK